MNWTEATIFTDTQGIDAVISILMDLGVEGFAIEDKEDFAAFLEDTEIYWDYVDDDLMKEKSEQETKVKIYLDPKEANETVSLIRQELKTLKARDFDNQFGRCEVEISTVNQQDWENNWKQYFKPFTVGERFVIKPSWEQYEENTDRIILEIDPASSFGTGSHNTTQLCMCELEKYVTKDCKLLDMGAGSGILSLAAALLGAGDITAVDIDPNCIKTSLENAEKNNLTLKTFCGDVTNDVELEQDIGVGFDVIVANIVADVIIGMREIFKRKLKPNGILITSGIIDSRADEVYNAILDAGFEILSREQSGDWVEITATIR